MRLISKFIVGHGADAHVNAAALRDYARQLKAQSLAKTAEQAQEGLNQFNRLLSSGAGVAALNQIEGDYEVLNIMRDSIALDFMEVRPLPVGTLPIYRTKIKNPVNVVLGSLFAGGATHNYITNQTAASVMPFTISSDKVMTPNLNNLYDMEKLGLRKDANEAIEQSLELVINNICVNTAFRATNLMADPAATIVAYAGTGGSFAGKTVYSLNPGVQSAALPTVNYYDLTTEGGLTKKVFQTLNTHSIQIGRNFRRMYIPTAAVAGKAPVWESLQNMATPVALITATGLNNDPAKAVPAEMWAEFQKEDFRGEVVIDWFGQKIAVSKQNWLPAGYCVVFSDQPCGILWDRLSLEGPSNEGTLETPIDGFFSYKQKSKNIATLSADYHLRNFALLKVQ